MYFTNLTQQILHEMWQRKLRSALALFCIMWGTLTVLLLLALSDGFQKASQKDLMDIADGAFFIIPQQTSQSFQGLPKGQPLNIKAPDMANLKQEVPNVLLSTPVLIDSAKLGVSTRQITKDIYGVGGDFAAIRKINLIKNSRFILPFDIAQEQRVAVIGYKVKTILFPKKNALGEKIKINNAPFTIIGVVKPPDKNTYNWYDDSIIIPYPAFTSLYGKQNVIFIAVLPDPKIDPKIAEQDLRTYFAHRYHFAPDDKKALKIFSTTKIFQFFKWFFLAIKIFLAGCGALTLAVGSLGVTNIMYLIVTERTKEIGLRIAVGARSWHILMQILLEALIIVGIGGFLGFAISFFVITVLQHVPLPEWLGTPMLSTSSVFITIAILALLGLLAGFFPARRAAKMDPITALGFGE